MCFLVIVSHLIHKCFWCGFSQSLPFTKWRRGSLLCHQSYAGQAGAGLQVNSELKIQCTSERLLFPVLSLPGGILRSRPAIMRRFHRGTQHFKFILFLLIPCTLYFIPATLPAVNAAQITIAWDQNPEPDIAGYRMHYGTTSGNYQHNVDVGNHTSCTISGLEEGTTYYFAATAYVSENVESGYSEQLAYTIPVTDSDGDGISDNDEINIYGTDPNKSDTDDDGISDGEELSFWGDQWNMDNDGDGLINLLDPDPDGKDVNGGNDPSESDPEPLVTLFLEIGEVQIDQNWQYVELKRLFISPIVIAKSISLHDADPAVIRIRNVDENGFEIRVQEWDYLDGTHAEETVSYLVMESGNYTLDDGTKVEAGMFETDKTRGFEPVSFSQSFQKIPVVVTSILSINESDAVIGRIRNIDTQGFDFRLQEQEGNSKNHVTESIGYIAWEPSRGTIDNLTFEINKTSDSVTHNFYTIQFSQNFLTTPMFVADMQTCDSINTANVRWQNKDAYAVEVQIDEEQSKDNEIRHNTEVVGYMVFSR